jgi:ABC-type transport system involved in multi-copper enzyme maturation permease subunit
MIATGGEPVLTSPRKANWVQRKNQLISIVKIELKRNFLTKRGLWIYFLAFAPAAVVALHALESPGGLRCTIEQDTGILAGIVQLFYLRLGIFFGCLGIFTWLFRGEVVQRSLHYYFLAPLRRELLVIGKFLAGAITASILFGAGVTVCFFFMYSHFGPRGDRFVFDGPGLGHLGTYLIITVLACLGYGAVFLALSLIFRNPIVPAAMVFGWETISGVLPAFLQKFSITFYLKNLAPVDVPARGLMSLFTVVADPVRPIVAVPGLLLLVATMLVFACFWVRTMEISYSKE